MEEKLKKIRDFADQAHGLQTRKYRPDPYIIHPERVAENCRKHGAGFTVLAAALLHDVLEDTSVSKQDMATFLDGVVTQNESKEIVRLVVELTDVYTKKAFPDLNREQRKQKETARISQTSIDSQTIKYADIIDNCTDIVHYDRSFAPNYLKECLAVLEVSDKGNQTLYNLAVKTLQEEQRKLISNR